MAKKKIARSYSKVNLEEFGIVVPSRKKESKRVNKPFNTNISVDVLALFAAEQCKAIYQNANE